MLERDASSEKPNWYREIVLNPNEAAACRSLAESVAGGHSIIMLHNVASAAECAAIAEEASSAACKAREERGLSGLVRMPVKSLVGAECTALCDALLLRQIAWLDSLVPSLIPNLFGDLLAASTKTVFDNTRLDWSEGEPAINVYTPGGCFTPHEDEQSLTCLLNVSPKSGYTGGGTSFWSTAGAVTALDTDVSSAVASAIGTLAGPATVTAAFSALAVISPPTCLLAPPAGTALVFGGQVTHAAQPLDTGERIVFVASFSPAADAEPPDESAEVSASAPLQADAEDDCSLEELCAALTGLPPAG